MKGNKHSTSNTGSFNSLSTNRTNRIIFQVFLILQGNIWRNANQNNTSDALQIHSIVKLFNTNSYMEKLIEFTIIALKAHIENPFHKAP